MEKDGDNGGHCLVTGKAVLIAFITDEGYKIKKTCRHAVQLLFFSGEKTTTITVSRNVVPS
jgi:hypothetical protein